MNRDFEEDTAGKIHNRANKFRQYVDELNKCLQFLEYSKLNWMEKREYRKRCHGYPQMPSRILLDDLRFEIDTQRMSKLYKLDAMKIEDEQND